MRRGMIKTAIMIAVQTVVRSIFALAVSLLVGKADVPSQINNILCSSGVTCCYAAFYISKTTRRKATSLCNICNG